MRDELIKHVGMLVTPFIEEISAELIELNIRRRGKTVVIDIIADKTAGGITVDECAYINKKTDQAIEERQWFGGDYVVEVSSPGLDRALKTPRDFSRVSGRRVRVHLAEPIEEKVEYLGEVAGLRENQVLIQINGKTVTIPLAYITKAVQVIE